MLALFFLIDSHFFYKRETAETRQSILSGVNQIGVTGRVNILLMAGIVGAVLLSGIWRPGRAVDLAGVSIPLQDMTRDGVLLLIVCLSLWLTPVVARQKNRFGWAPVVEVAKLFIGIFITITPVIDMLKAGAAGPFSGIIALVTKPGGEPDNAMYFWATGLLSSFLDNAPTYLVFFNTASGDAQVLMNALSSTLAAISCGAVFMGANSYIGNAPNLMVKAIAKERGIRMPSFFAYTGWSVVILFPVFLLMTWFFFI